MTRQEAVNDIIDGDGKIESDHPYVDDILFYNMLKTAAEEKEWFEVCMLAKTQIMHIENKQRVGNLKEEIKNKYNDEH